MSKQVSPKNKFPQISIVIPSFNKAEYITRTLDSIVNQNYPNLEILVEDGGSTDGTVELINQFRRRFSYIKLRSSQDGGQVDAINQGLAKARGDVLTYLNADDVYKPKTLWLVAESFINQRPLWLTGFGDIIDKNDQVISSWVTSYKNLLLQANRYQLLLMTNYITQAATFISRQAFETIGPFTGTERYVMEYEYWLKLGQIKMPQLIRRELASFRLVNGSISVTSFMDLLNIDQQIAEHFTTNIFILLLHQLHNLARIYLVRLFKKE